MCESDDSVWGYICGRIRARTHWVCSVPSCREITSNLRANRRISCGADPRLACSGAHPVRLLLFLLLLLRLFRLFLLLLSLSLSLFISFSTRSNDRWFSSLSFTLSHSNAINIYFISWLIYILDKTNYKWQYFLKMSGIDFIRFISFEYKIQIKF